MNKIDYGFIGNVQFVLDRIKEKKELIDASRPLSTMAIERIRKDIALEWTYNSNGIEGNSLTLAETRVVLEDGMTIGGKSLREHFEAVNHERAIGYLEELVGDDYEFRLLDIYHLHELVLQNIEDNYAGRVRDGMVRIIGANFTPPSPRKVPDYMRELIDFVNNNELELDIPILASIFHHKMVWIHPFFDGNGRTARLAMNLILMQHGYPPCIILKNDRKKYYKALNHANNGNYEKICLMILQGIERSLNIYVNIIPKAYKEYDSISNIAEEPDVPYGMEYISLLARRGLINAHKEGRNWVTTKDDVLGYVRAKNRL